MEDGRIVKNREIEEAGDWVMMRNCFNKRKKSKNIKREIDST